MKLIARYFLAHLIAQKRLQIIGNCQMLHNAVYFQLIVLGKWINKCSDADDKILIMKHNFHSNLIISSWFDDSQMMTMKMFQTQANTSNNNWNKQKSCLLSTDYIFTLYLYWNEIYFGLGPLSIRRQIQNYLHELCACVGEFNSPSWIFPSSTKIIKFRLQSDVKEVLNLSIRRTIVMMLPNQRWSEASNL